MSFEVKEEIIVNESNSIGGDEIKTYVENKQVKKENQQDNQQVNTVNIYREGETQVKMESEQNNNQPNNNPTIPTNKKNRKWIIVSIIIGVILVVGVAVTLDCVLKSSKKDDESSPITPPETPITTGAGEEIVVEIQRKLNQIWIYQGSDVVVTTSTKMILMD